MANVFIEESTLQAIADSIRSKTDSEDKYLPADMPAQIDAIITNDTSIEDWLVTGENKPDEYINDRVATVRAYFMDNLKENCPDSISFENATLVGDYAFRYMSSSGDNQYGEGIKNVNLPNCKRLGTYAFQKQSLSGVLNLKNVDTLGTYCFAYSMLEGIELPLVESIPNGCFQGCSNLASFDFSNIKTLNSSAFDGCSALRYCNAPLVTNIATYGFRNCTLLEKVKLGSIVKFNSNSFMGCSNLTALILTNESGICSLSGTNAFNNTPIASGEGYIYVPSALIEEYKAATNWTTYANQFRAIEDYPDIVGGE